MPSPKKIHSGCSLRNSGPGRPKDIEKAEAIMIAAGQLFIQNGFSNVTMDTIAKKAGVSKLTVYNHFGSKDELFNTVIRTECASQINKALFEHLDGENPEEDFWRIGLAFLSIIYTEEALAMYRTVVSECRNNDKIAKLFHNAAHGHVRKHFEKYLRKLEKRQSFTIANKKKASDIFFTLLKNDAYHCAVLRVKPKPTESQLSKIAKDNAKLFLQFILS